MKSIGTIFLVIFMSGSIFSQKKTVNKLELALGVSYSQSRLQLKLEQPISTKSAVFLKMNHSFENVIFGEPISFDTIINTISLEQSIVPRFDSKKVSLLNFTLGYRIYLSQLEYVHNGFYLDAGIGYTAYLAEIDEILNRKFDPIGVEFGFGYKFIIGKKVTIDLGYANYVSQINSTLKNKFTNWDAYLHVRVGYNFGNAQTLRIQP